MRTLFVQLCGLMCQSTPPPTTQPITPSKYIKSPIQYICESINPIFGQFQAEAWEVRRFHVGLGWRRKSGRTTMGRKKYLNISLEL